ncbi:MAG TPA: aldo/keto reductase [Bryobacteraceae bacterium]|nr:aldo/keto reductase [Bryobacteraceae bacterium]
MKLVSLPGTDLTVSRLCLGTMTFGSQVDEAGSLAMVDTALDAGINFFDTANVYNAGRSEEIMAKAMAGRRDKFVLATKVRGRMGDGPDEQGLSKAAILKQCEASLQRLKTDYIDVYYMHMQDHAVPIEESLEAIDSLVKAGKVRHPAVSNFGAWQILEMQYLAATNGWKPVHICQPMYNLLARNIEAELLPMAAKHKVSTFVYNPLAGGLLSGKHKPEEAIKGSRFDGNKMYRDRYWYDEQFDAVTELSFAAGEAHRSLVSIALNWVLHHTTATGLILGASQMRHLTANIAACQEGPLDESTLTVCESVWKRLRGVTPEYIR